MSKVGTATAGGAGCGGSGAAGGAAAGGVALGAVDGADCGAAAVGLVALSRTACSLIRTCHATPRPAAITIAPATTSQITVRDIILPTVRLPAPIGVATFLCEMIPCWLGPERRRIVCK
ncbi:MAG: hypothetical protein GEV13_07370 [Rhodospirillales bacterium]|nr:hypothetical protein [Rhodospirillales bacterium]